MSFSNITLSSHSVPSATIKRQTLDSAIKKRVHNRGSAVPFAPPRLSNYCGGGKESLVSITYACAQLSAIKPFKLCNIIISSHLKLVQGY